MVAALDSRPPPAAESAPRQRAKALAIDDIHIDTHVEHLESESRKVGRKRSRELLKQGLTETRCDASDVAEALGINVRGAGRAVIGERPFDLGDLLAIAASSRATLRTALRVHALIGLELARIESAFHK